MSSLPLLGVPDELAYAKPDVFTDKLVSHGKAVSKPPVKALTKLSAPVARGPPDQAVKTPPRLVSDQLINIFFQEWAPLYPVLHRPTILKAYEQYLNNTDSLKNDIHVMAQLNLIFGIAALSSGVSCYICPDRRTKN